MADALVYQAIQNQSKQSYDSLNDMYKISSMQKKWRDTFAGSSINSNTWDVTNATGMTTTVSGGVLTVTTGTTVNVTQTFLSKETFIIPMKAMIGFTLSAAPAANQSVYFEFVSVDPTTGTPDGKSSCGWFIDNGCAVSQAKYFVQAGSASALNSSAVTVNTWTSYNILEWEPFADECWFHGRQMDSSNGRSQSYVRHQQLPDPNSTYKFRIRLINGSTTPSNITFNCQYALVNDYAELTAEITAGRGNIVAGQAIGVSVTNTPSVTISGTPSVSVSNTPAVTISGTGAVNLSQVGGTSTVTGGVSGLLAVGGNVAVNAAPTANPLRIAGRGVNALPTSVTSGNLADLLMTLAGAIVEKPYSIPEREWNYAAASGGITTATTVALKAADASYKNYIVDVQISNTGAADTECQILDGATVLWRCVVKAGTTQIIDFANPLKNAAINTALNFTVVTASTVYVNAQGYSAP